jgi:hypothetical protein
MNQRLPLVIATTALAVALVGSTPVGQAAESVLDQIVPRAKRADLAANAVKLNGHRSSFNPKPGQIPVVSAEGKLPESIGAVGPQGPQGPAGPRGASGYVRVQENVTVPDGTGAPDFGVSCPGGRSVFGGGYSFRKVDTDALFVFESRPASDSEWRIKVSNETGGNKPMTLYAVCVNVG